MKVAVLCALGALSSIGFVACGNHAESRGSANSSSSGTKEYSSSAPVVRAEPASDSGDADVKTLTLESADRVLKQNVSLAQTSASAIDTAPSDRKVIRNAELELEDEDPDAAHREITSIAESKGGFVVESQQ